MAVARRIGVEAGRRSARCRRSPRDGADDRRPRDEDRDISHDDCVRSIVDHIVDSDLEDVVLVGHSFGGTVIARVAGEIPERIRRLVFWNAFVPEDGNALTDEIPPHYQELFESLANASGDNTVACRGRSGARRSSTTPTRSSRAPLRRSRRSRTAASPTSSTSTASTRRRSRAAISTAAGGHRAAAGEVGLAPAVLARLGLVPAGIADARQPRSDVHEPDAARAQKIVESRGRD